MRYLLPVLATVSMIATSVAFASESGPVDGPAYRPQPRGGRQPYVQPQDDYRGPNNGGRYRYDESQFDENYQGGRYQGQFREGGAMVYRNNNQFVPERNIYCVQGSPQCDTPVALPYPGPVLRPITLPAPINQFCSFCYISRHDGNGRLLPRGIFDLVAVGVNGEKNLMGRGVRVNLNATIWHYQDMGICTEIR
jgi:hypothetical protein